MVTPQSEENLALKTSLKDQESGQDRRPRRWYNLQAREITTCAGEPPCFIPEDQVLWQDYVKEPCTWDGQEAGTAWACRWRSSPDRPYGWPADRCLRDRPWPGTCL